MEDFNGTLMIPVSVIDGTSDSDAYDLSVSVEAVNDIPLITGQKPLYTQEGNELAIELSHLILTDPDNTYPDDFSLTVLDRTYYTHAGNTVTPSPGFSGTLTVPISVSDGIADSDVFSLSITVEAVSIRGQVRLPDGTPVPSAYVVCK